MLTFSGFSFWDKSLSCRKCNGYLDVFTMKSPTSCFELFTEFYAIVPANSVFIRTPLSCVLYSHANSTNSQDVHENIRIKRTVDSEALRISWSSSRVFGVGGGGGMYIRTSLLCKENR